MSNNNYTICAEAVRATLKLSKKKLTTKEWQVAAMDIQPISQQGNRTKEQNMSGYSKQTEPMVSIRRAVLEGDGNDRMIADRRKRCKTNGARTAVLFEESKCKAADDASHSLFERRVA